MSKRDYQICIRCVMDTSDPLITFDENGVCNHCLEFDTVTQNNWYPNEAGSQKLNDLFSKIKRQAKGKPYDCIIGLSGGVDSSYLAIVLKKYELRPLVVHVDAGWNSEIAVSNIEKIVKNCGYDLHTHVMNWSEVRDLQLAYIKSGLANQDVVQDHAFFASLYHFAVKNKIKYVISGGNIATEGVFPRAWHHSAMDARQLKAVHKKFGKIKLKEYKTIGFFSYFFYYPFVKGMTVIRPLNYMYYDREMALHELKEKVGYKEYGKKHGESRFTRFFQNYYLIKKFGYDKRRPHLSSQILAGALLRERAIQILNEPLYNKDELEFDKVYIAKKLGISVAEFEDYINSPGHHYTEYKNWDAFYKLVKFGKKVAYKILGRKLKSYG